MSHSEHPKTRFENYDKMKASGIIEAGWVPYYFPRSATDIHEQHDLDTNQVNIDFKYKKEDIKELQKICTTLFENDEGYKFICPPYDERSSIFNLHSDGVGYYSSASEGLKYKK